MTILVSACLLGANCRYDGESRPSPEILALADRHTLIPFCPEVLGGLPTPRIPAEFDGERVRNRKGEDVTAFFKRGAQQALRLARHHSPDLIILKDKSPSCGVGLRYSGAFDGILVTADGMTAALFKREGFRILSVADLTREILDALAAKE